MGRTKLWKSDDYEVMVGDGKIMQYRRVATTFGDRHGGPARLALLMTIVQVVAFAGAFVLAIWLGGSGYSSTTKAILLVGFVGICVLVDLVLAVLYIRLRYLMAGLAILVGVPAFGAVIYWALWELLV